MHRRERRGSVGALAWALATLLASSAMAAQGDEEAAQGPGLGAKLANWVTAGETGGSLQYGVGVVEVGGLVGGLAGSGGLATGVHYTERGSVLAQFLFAGGAGAGAGMRAQTTGQDQNYTIADTWASSSGWSRR